MKPTWKTGVEGETNRWVRLVEEGVEGTGPACGPVRAVRSTASEQAAGEARSIKADHRCRDPIPRVLPTVRWR